MPQEYSIVDPSALEATLNRDVIGAFNTGLNALTTQLNKDLLQTKQSLATLNINQESAELEAQQQNDNLKQNAESAFNKLNLGIQNINELFQNSLSQLNLKEKQLDLETQKSLEKLGISKESFQRDIDFQRKRIQRRFEFYRSLSDLNFNTLKDKINTELKNLRLSEEVAEKKLNTLKNLTSLAEQQANLQKELIKKQTDFVVKNAQIQKIGFEQAISGQKILSRKALANRKAFASQSAGHNAIAQELAVFDISLRIGQQISQSVRYAQIQKERILYEEKQAALKKQGINLSLARTKKHISFQKDTLKVNKLKIENEITNLKSRLNIEQKRKDITDIFL